MTRTGWDKRDPRMIRLKNIEAKTYLHMSGRGETKNVDHAWLSYQYQADTLKERALTRGEEWPYRKVRRKA